MLARTTTRWQSLPLTPCGNSKRETVALRLSHPHPRTLAGAAVLATPSIGRIIDWCEDCCSLDWDYETSDLGLVLLAEVPLPVYVFYFRSPVDLIMFERAHRTEIRLALEVNA